MKHIKKLVTVTLILMLCVILYYQYANKDSKGTSESGKNDGGLSEIEKVLTKNLDEYYPKTPLEVVKFFTRIQKCYYNEDNTDEVTEELGKLARTLMDEKLLEQNPEEEYLSELKDEISTYKTNKKTISNVIFDKSTDVRYINVNGSNTASLECTYYIQTGKRLSSTTETYVLRKDSNNQWKIYGWKLDEPTELEK